MVFDQVKNKTALEWVAAKPLQDRRGKSSALGGVAAHGAALPRVMQQRGEVEQARMLQFALQCGKAARPFAHGRSRLCNRRKRMQGIEQHKGVFIDGVAVIGIAHHQSVDAVELWHS